MAEESKEESPDRTPHLEAREVPGHPGRYEGQDAEEWNPAQRAAYREAERARQAREAAREAGGAPTVLDEFRAFQRKWEENQARAEGRVVSSAAEAALARTRELAQSLRDHWQGRTPPAQVPILVRAYQAQRERERRAIDPEREHGYGR